MNFDKKAENGPAIFYSYLWKLLLKESISIQEGMATLEEVV